MEDDTKRQQKDGGRKRGQRNQREIDVAVQTLPRPATLAAVKVFFVVCAHLWREAGDIVPPARKNFSYNGINAFAHTEDYNL